MLIIDILIAEEALVKHFPDMLVLTSPRSLLVAHSIVTFRTNEEFLQSRDKIKGKNMSYWIDNKWLPT
jgi:hypothetical protein